MAKITLGYALLVLGSCAGQNGTMGYMGTTGATGNTGLGVTGSQGATGQTGLTGMHAQAWAIMLLRMCTLKDAGS